MRALESLFYLHCLIYIMAGCRPHRLYKRPPPKKDGGNTPTIYNRPREGRVRTHFPALNRLCTCVCVCVCVCICVCVDKHSYIHAYHQLCVCVGMNSRTHTRTFKPTIRNVYISGIYVFSGLRGRCVSLTTHCISMNKSLCPKTNYPKRRQTLGVVLSFSSQKNT